MNGRIPFIFEVPSGVDVVWFLRVLVFEVVVCEAVKVSLLELELSLGLELELVL